MSLEGSVTNWFGRLQGGDAVAAQQLWERYFHRLVGLARARLQGFPRRAADEEDVALSAFDTFCRNAERGRFPQLHDRAGLWNLLVTLTVRKVYHLVRDEGPAGQTVLDEAALAQVIGREPTPEFAAEVAEECQRRLALLDEGEVPKKGQLRSIALWKMEAFSNEEIAEKLGCALSTVERRLQLIRRIWGEEGEG
jgi:DNA-directed RNA polymerase specialized sigma24 family protein